MDALQLSQIGWCGLIGLGAGVLGGLAGVGGSILILPALGMLFGYPRLSSHHSYMASAMAVNLVVAIPAAMRHRAAGAVRGDLVRKLLPPTAISLALGVIASNWFAGWHLQFALAAGLVGYCGYLAWTIWHRAPEHQPAAERTTPARLIISGSLTGGTAGFLGLGGGILQVPLLQGMCRVPLRNAIATSSAVICLTAVIGAGLKLLTLSNEGESAWLALVHAAAMAPTAIIGARLGASMTHRLPLGWVRSVIAVMLMIAAWRLASSAGKMAGFW